MAMLTPEADDVNTAVPARHAGRPASTGLDAGRHDPRSRGDGPLDRLANLVRQVVPTRSRAETVGWLLAWFSLVAAAVDIAAIVVLNVAHNGWPAYDTNAYELAAQHLLHGQPLYAPALIWTSGAYKYPPLFAQLVLPIGLMPEMLVDWAWRVCSVLFLRYLCGSWKMTILAIPQAFVISELNFGNVTLALGAVALWSFRDRRAIYLLPWFAAMKFGPVLLLPYLWATRPEARRPIVIGCAVFAGACLASFAVAPSLWWDYLGTYGWEVSSQMQANYVYAIVPDHGGLDFAIRFAIAVVAILVAIRWRLDWLAFIAATATMPIFSLTRLAVMVALWPLYLRGVVDRWRRHDGLLQSYISALLVHLDMLPPMQPASAPAR